MNNAKFLCGVGMGLILGSAIGLSMPKKKCGKSMLGKALKSMGNIVENISDTMGL